VPCESRTAQVETVVLEGDSVAEALASYAAESGVRSLVLGNASLTWLRRWGFLNSENLFAPHSYRTWLRFHFWGLLVPDWPFAEMRNRGHRTGTGKESFWDVPRSIPLTNLGCGWMNILFFLCKLNLYFTCFCLCFPRNRIGLTLPPKVYLIQGIRV